MEAVSGTAEDRPCGEPAAVCPAGTLGAERGRGARRLALPLLLVVAAALFAVPFWWGLPSYNSWAFDEIEPEHLEPGRWPAKYPLVHRDLLGALYVPAGWLADRLELEGLYRASYLQAAARLLSVLLSLGTVALIYGCARELGGGESERDRRSCHLHGLFAAAIVATLPPFVFYAKTANLEAPYLFWLTLSLLFFLRLLRRQRWGDYLFFAVAAVLTIGTKDQAYGLYVASPLPILAALSRHHRASGTRRPWLRAMLDPKVWATGAVTFLGLALVHRVGIDPEWLPRHLEVITGSASQDYRAYPATLMGQWELARASGRHLSFCLGLPLLVAALAGLWRFRRGLALGLLALSYYLTFMVPIGYSYVRFFLPVCLLLALPAGRLLARLWCRRGRGYLGRWLVVAVLAHAGLRGAAVDLLMLRDARYPAERLLAAAEGHAVGLGPATLLPRLELVRWGQLRGRECRALAERDARYVVIHPVELIDPRIVARLKHGEMGYRLLARFRQQPLLGLLELDGVETNLAKIARDVQVYERDGPCFDVSDVYAVLSRIREGAPQASDRSEVARYLIRNPRIGIRRLGLGVLAAGFSPDLWTNGADPALLVFGGGALGGTPVLHLVCGMPESELPFPIVVDDGGSVSRHACELRGPISLELAPVPAGEARLVALWAERAWQTPRGRRHLGIRLGGVELAPEGHSGGSRVRPSRPHGR